MSDDIESPQGPEGPNDGDPPQTPATDVNPTTDEPSSGERMMATKGIPTERIFRPGPIVFLDMKEREEQERAHLENERFLLAQQKAQDKKLPPDLEERLKKIDRMLASKDVVDPFFRAVRDTLAQLGYDAVGDHVEGKLPSQQKAETASASDGGERFTLTDAERALAAVYGLLGADNQTNPEVGDRAAEVDRTQLRVSSRFFTAVTVALGEYTAVKALHDRVLRVVAAEGQRRNGEQYRVARTPQVAVIVRGLREDGVTADDEQLALQVRVRLSNQIAALDTAVPSAINIDLPDLEAQTDMEIVADNIRAMQALYFSAMLEQLGIFRVTDKLVELFQNGLLPFGRGPAGDLLFQYWKKGVNRFNEVERLNISARALGLPGGDPMIENVNRERHDLTMHFASTVSSFVRQFRVDDLLRSTIPLRVNSEQLRKSAFDLAANLSLHGYGIAHFAATELQTQVREIIAILSHPEVRMAYGARDMWQVVDQVSALELGGARSSVRYRTLATSGSIMIRWLAERAHVLTAGYGTDLLNMAELRRPVPRPAGTKPTTHPTDRDLVDAAEQWLAVHAISDQRVMEYAQPIEGPAITSRPVVIPQVARDLLDSVGISAGYGDYGNGGAGGKGHSRIPSEHWG